MALPISMLVQVAIQFSVLEKEVKELHGIHGKSTTMLHQHFQCSLVTTLESVESLIKPLERFVILLYDRTSNLECVNRARKQLVIQKGRSMKGIPPQKQLSYITLSRQLTRLVTAGPK